MSLNKAQEGLLKIIIEEFLDYIFVLNSEYKINKYNNNPSICLFALKLIHKKEISPAEQITLQEYGLWEGVVKSLRAIIKHPCPQNRTEDYPYFDPHIDKNLIVYKDNNNKPAFEEVGMLCLSAKNDDTTECVTKEDVLDYIDILVKERIQLLEDKKITPTLVKISKPKINLLFNNEDIQNLLSKSYCSFKEVNDLYNAASYALKFISKLNHGILFDKLGFSLEQVYNIYKEDKSKLKLLSSNKKVHKLIEFWEVDFKKIQEISKDKLQLFSCKAIIGYLEKNITTIDVLQKLSLEKIKLISSAKLSKFISKNNIIIGGEEGMDIDIILLLDNCNIKNLSKVTDISLKNILQNDIKKIELIFTDEVLDFIIDYKISFADVISMDIAKINSLINEEMRLFLNESSDIDFSDLCALYDLDPYYIEVICSDEFSSSDDAGLSIEDVLEHVESLSEEKHPLGKGDNSITDEDYVPV